MTVFYAADDPLPYPSMAAVVHHIIELHGPIKVEDMQRVLSERPFTHQVSLSQVRTLLTKLRKRGLVHTPSRWGVYEARQPTNRGKVEGGPSVPAPAQPAYRAAAYDDQPDDPDPTRPSPAAVFAPAVDPLD